MARLDTFRLKDAWFARTSASWASTLLSRSSYEGSVRHTFIIHLEGFEHDLLLSHRQRNQRIGDAVKKGRCSSELSHLRGGPQHRSNLAADGNSGSTLVFLPDTLTFCVWLLLSVLLRAVFKVLTCSFRKPVGFFS